MTELLAAELLPPTGVCDLTTIGARTGLPRTVEIWYVVHDGRIHITGTPGGRHWLANLRADPGVRLALRDPHREVELEAREVTDPQQRARLTETAWRLQPWYAEQGHTRQEWITAAPMIALSELTGWRDA